MKVLHIIDSLHQGGGAETLVAGTISGLSEHDHVLVTLSSRVDFDQEIKQAKRYVIQLEQKWQIWKVRKTLRSLIWKEQPDIIHAHLPLATFVARISKPKAFPLLFSVHNTLSQSLKGNSNLLFWLEKKLYTSAQIPIFVSEYVKKDYENFATIKGKSYVLHNYIADVFYSNDKENIPPANGIRRFVAVGSLTRQKNYPFLIHTFKQLEEKGFSLDIYGDGSGRDDLQSLIESFKVTNVCLMGKSTEIANVLQNYDAYILASSFEGFGIAPMEAAAVGLPLFLSDIPVFREIFREHAHYFSIEHPEQLVEMLTAIGSNRDEVHKKTSRAQLYALQFNKQRYLERLQSIYEEAVRST